LISIWTPTLFTAGTNGLMLITIFPFEFVHVAGLGFGTITTVAQLPVPPPEQSELEADLTVTLIVPVAFGQPDKVYVTLIATTVPALPLGLNVLPVTPVPDKCESTTGHRGRY